MFSVICQNSEIIYLAITHTHRDGCAARISIIRNMFCFITSYRFWPIHTPLFYFQNICIILIIIVQVFPEKIDSNKSILLKIYRYTNINISDFQSTLSIIIIILIIIILVGRQALLCKIIVKHIFIQKYIWKISNSEKYTWLTHYFLLNKLLLDYFISKFIQFLNFQHSFIHWFK